MVFINKIVRFLVETAPPAAKISAFFAFIFLSFFFYDRYFNVAIVEGSVTKYNYKNIISYGGKLVNTSSKHANEFTMKSQFDNAAVIDLKIHTMDTIEKSTYGTPKETAEFSLKRLSKQSKCFFDIVIRPKGEVNEKIHISWGNDGLLKPLPIKVDEDTARSIERGMYLLSLNQREKWVRDNSKNIR